MVISSSPLASPRGHTSNGANPRATLVIMTRSSTVTWSSPPQSPAQGGRVGVGDGVAVMEPVGLAGAGVAVGDGERVPVGDTVELGDGSPVGLGGGCVGLDVGAGVAGLVGGAVGLGDGSDVGLRVAVRVAVVVGLTVGVGVSVTAAPAIAGQKPP